MLHAAPNHMVAFQIAKQSVIEGDTSFALAKLEPFIESKEVIKEYEGTLSLLFDGYDSDRRALSQIPEVRQFVRNLTDVFPYWFHFCSKTDESLLMILGCLIPMDCVVSDGQGRVGYDFSEEVLGPVLLRLFAGMNSLYDLHEISEEDNERVTATVLDYMLNVGD